MYDQMADIYDRFIDWPARLERELPPLLAWLGEARRVADVACGTGRHAAALAAAGRAVVGFDPSGEALAAARKLPGATFVEAGFGELAATGQGPFEAVLSLGNSIPHLLTTEELRAAVDDLAAVLVPDGRILLHLRHLPLARARDDCWLPLRSHTDPDGTEWLFERHYDFLDDDRVMFHFVALFRPPDHAWQRRLHTTELRAWRPSELTAALAGWRSVTLWADLAGSAFDPAQSLDLFVTARRPVNAEQSG